MEPHDAIRSCLREATDKERGREIYIHTKLLLADPMSTSATACTSLSTCFDS